MTRATSAAVVLAMVLSLGQAASQESTPGEAAPIQPPAHPRQLRYPPADWQPPSAAQHRVDLPAGATAFLIQDSTLPLVDIVVVSRAGADNDPADRPGLSELTTTMLRRGGTLDLEPDLFDERADELGAILTSQATMLYGAASLRCTSDVLEEAVELLLDMIEQPRFAPERLASIKGNLAEGLARRNLDPVQLLEREWEWLMYGRRHFSTRPLRLSDLDGLTVEVIDDFHRRYWRPDNFTIAAAGDLDADRLRSLFGPRLRDWRTDPEPPPGRWPPEPPPPASRAGLFHAEADIPQAKVAIGHRAPRDLPSVDERIRLEVTAEILGGRGAISRLSGRLRSAEGLVYRTTTRLSPGDLWPADYQILFDTLDSNVPRAVAAALEEVDRLRNTLPRAEELQIVQRELVARQQQAFDTAEEAAGYLVEDSLVGRQEAYRSRYRELVEAVTAQEVLATARRHLRPSDLTILIVGRWSPAGGEVAADGWSELERLTGHRVEHLPRRDPLTLEPVR